jgi:hypothetical protein
MSLANKRSNRPMLAGFLALGIVIVSVGIMAIYAFYIRHTATELVKSARQIRSGEEARRVIDEWKVRLPGQYSAAPDGNGYRFELNNGWLSTFRIVPRTGIQLQVVNSPTQLQLVTIGMYNNKASVWVQEDFSASGVGQLHISSEQNILGKISKAVVMFDKDQSKTTQSLAFALDPDCLVRVGGCDAAETMLPTIKQLLPLQSAMPRGFRLGR